MDRQILNYFIILKNHIENAMKGISDAGNYIIQGKSNQEIDEIFTSVFFKDLNEALKTIFSIRSSNYNTEDIDIIEHHIAISKKAIGEAGNELSEGKPRNEINKVLEMIYLNELKPALDEIHNIENSLAKTTERGNGPLR